ncbi:MAG TPA: FxsA family protein, partial [Bacillus sp. (in: firmicutes)]|nr:FxsA family protein [Bacillus sp. (in: firmicutes)]
IFILVPVAELGVLLFSGQKIGVWPTLILLIVTGLLGSYLAKKQGINTIRKVQEQIQFGRVPGNEILDGLCVLFGGILLLSPGFLTDILGLVLLLPFTRTLIKPFILKLLRKWIDKNTFTNIR